MPLHRQLSGGQSLTTFAWPPQVAGHINHGEKSRDSGSTTAASGRGSDAHTGQRPVALEHVYQACRETEQSADCCT